MSTVDASFERAKQHFLEGVRHSLSENWLMAENEFKASLALVPNRVSTLTNLCAVLLKLQKLDESRSVLDQAYSLDASNPELTLNEGLILSAEKRHEHALSSFDRAVALNNDYTEGWINRGVALSDLKRYAEALASYERAIEIHPSCAEAWSNRSNVLNALRRHEEALDSARRAVSIKESYAEAWCNAGHALSALGRYEEALHSYERSIELKPHADYVLGDLLHAKMKICDWTDLSQQYDLAEQKLLSGSRASAPFPILGLFDNAELQRKCAEIYANDKLAPGSPIATLAKRTSRSRIRVAYFSMDFREHPVAHLIADLVELHDRDRFEVFGVSFGSASDEDPMRRRLEMAFDEFLEVRNLSDLEIARLARDLEIDIAVDLGGHTQDSRPAIFAHRSAPIQINYLGFPGTMGSKHHDYIIGDRVTISEVNLGQFSEKVIFLPHSFQANPRQRPIGSMMPTRAHYGLPERGFIYCCFNNTWKITPECFGRWVRILREVPSSVLWLFVSSEAARRNLKSRFLDCGIEERRLIFAGPVLREDYLAQYQVADLFLDTLPYNAGTTASDALYVGLPVLTLLGNSFAGRMAASLLRAVGLPELITETPQAYESLAIELAKTPDRIAELKKRLVDNRASCPLFNTHLFTQHIESAYQTAHDCHHAGHEPDHIHVTS